MMNNRYCPNGGNLIKINGNMVQGMQEEEGSTIVAALAIIIQCGFLQIPKEPIELWSDKTCYLLQCDWEEILSGLNNLDRAGWISCHMVNDKCVAVTVHEDVGE